MKSGFSDEYHRATSHINPYWRAVRAATFAVTLGRDTIAPWLRARDLDHLHYGNLGREIPFFDVVPLSRTTHRIVTVARKLPFAKPLVNFALRASYAVWVCAWICVGLQIAWLAGAHVAHPSFTWLVHTFNEGTRLINWTSRFIATGKP